MTDVGLVLLAAGSSSRMGCAKQMLDYRGRPLVRHAAEIALASSCRPVFVVLGSRAERILAALVGLPVEAVIHPRWQEGIGSSIGAGVVAAARRGVTGVVLALADQVRLTPESFDRLVAEHLDSRSAVVASRYAGTFGAPAFFARRLFPELLDLDSGEGCKRLIREHAAEAIHLDCPEAETDIDTPEEYAELRGTRIPGPRPDRG